MKRLSSPIHLLAVLVVFLLLLVGCDAEPYGGGGGGGGGDGYVTVTLSGATGSDLSGVQSAVIQGLPLASLRVDLEPATARQ